MCGEVLTRSAATRLSGVRCLGRDIGLGERVLPRLTSLYGRCQDHSVENRECDEPFQAPVGRCPFSSRPDEEEVRGHRIAVESCERGEADV